MSEDAFPLTLRSVILEYYVGTADYCSETGCSIGMKLVRHEYDIEDEYHTMDACLRAFDILSIVKTPTRGSYKAKLDLKLSHMKHIVAYLRSTCLPRECVSFIKSIHVTFDAVFDATDTSLARATKGHMEESARAITIMKATTDPLTRHRVARTRTMRRRHRRHQKHW
jgi:hypothetical protein